MFFVLSLCCQLMCQHLKTQKKMPTIVLYPKETLEVREKHIHVFTLMLLNVSFSKHWWWKIQEHCLGGGF